MTGHGASRGDLGGFGDGVVRLGSVVRVRYAGVEREEDEFALVGAEEADGTADRVSTESPIGRAVLGRRAGERVRFRAPGGLMSVTLVQVR